MKRKNSNQIPVSKLWRFAKAHGYVPAPCVSPYTSCAKALEGLGFEAAGMTPKAFCKKYQIQIIQGAKDSAKSPLVPKLRQGIVQTAHHTAQSAHFAYVATDAFLSSYEWRRIRMEALKLHGRMCQCCGASPATGAVMNVDHIKPRKLFPALALTLDNLQVLCHECNHGKGNWDMTDWREKEIAPADLLAMWLDKLPEHGQPSH